MIRSSFGALVVASLCAASVAGCASSQDAYVKAKNSNSAAATDQAKATDKATGSATKPAATAKPGATKSTPARSGECPKADELEMAETKASDKVGKPVTIKGATGTATISEVDPGETPKFTFKDSPFTVKKTGVKVLSEGDGAVVPVGSTVTVEYFGVNGRDGNNFDSSYKRGKPATFPLNRVVKGFSKAIQCQKIGSHLVVAMTPEDGYGASGSPRAGIQPTDTLLFYIEIKGVDDGK